MYAGSQSGWESLPAGNQPQSEVSSLGRPPAIPEQPPQPNKKAKNHRRRHVPVGPAGTWFQAQQPSNMRPSAKAPNEEDDDESGIEFSQGARVQKPTATSFFSPAWVAMQCALRIVTPSLPPYLSVKERYATCRPHVPADYLMLAEVLMGQSDWKLSKPLLVLVETIDALADNLWMAEVTDETGAKMSSWIQPSLVHQEQQRAVPYYMRPGRVWLVQDATLLLVENEEGEEASRMMLIGENSIARVWSPGEDEELSDEEYIRWMERRNVLSSSSPALDMDEQGDPMRRLQTGRSSPQTSNHAVDSYELGFTSHPQRPEPSSEVRHQPSTNSPFIRKTATGERAIHSNASMQGSFKNSIPRRHPLETTILNRRPPGLSQAASTSSKSVSFQDEVVSVETTVLSPSFKQFAADRSNGAHGLPGGPSTPTESISTKLSPPTQICSQTSSSIESTQRSLSPMTPLTPILKEPKKKRKQEIWNAPLLDELSDEELPVVPQPRVKPKSILNAVTEKPGRDGLFGPTSVSALDLSDED